MTTIAYVFGAALVVGAEIAFAVAHFDGPAFSDRATLVEDRLDRELRELVLPGTPRGDASAAAGQRGIHPAI